MPNIPQGPEYPGSATSTGAGDQSWANTGNILASDDQYATVNLGPSQTSDLLVGQSFGFAIDPAASVTGILVEWERKSGALLIIDNSVTLARPGNVSNDRADPGYWPSTEAFYSYGGSTDLWGLTWTPSQINASSFQARLSVKTDNTSIVGDVASVDTVRVTVYYDQESQVSRSVAVVT